MAESPLVALSGRKEKDGRPFLSDDMVVRRRTPARGFRAGADGPPHRPELGPVPDRRRHRGAFAGDGGMAEGPKAARDRVLAALTDLGPGLGDVVLRCCCFLEGLEATERRMGWSARSGKIVLRIALQRL